MIFINLFIMISNIGQFWYISAILYQVLRYPTQSIRLDDNRYWVILIPKVIGWYQHQYWDSKPCYLLTRQSQKVLFIIGFEKWEVPWVFPPQLHFLSNPRPSWIHGFLPFARGAEILTLLTLILPCKWTCNSFRVYWWKTRLVSIYQYWL